MGHKTSITQRITKGHLRGSMRINQLWLGYKGYKGFGVRTISRFQWRFFVSRRTWIVLQMQKKLLFHPLYLALIYLTTISNTLETSSEDWSLYEILSGDYNFHLLLKKDYELHMGLHASSSS